MCAQIEQMLEDAWGKFCDYYDTETRKYLKKLPVKPNKKEAKKLHWICWNESDLMVQVGRYFYDQRRIKSVSNEEFLKIEMHFDKNLNRSNFEDYDFANKLNGDLKKELNESGKFPRGFPKLDLIITCENDFGPFLLCAEAKCFHTSERGRTVEEAIEKDIITLAAIEKLEITEKIAYIIFDDYYYNEKHPKDLEKISEDYSETYNIKDKLKILYHPSKCKLPEEFDAKP